MATYQIIRRQCPGGGGAISLIKTEGGVCSAAGEGNGKEGGVDGKGKGMVRKGGEMVKGREW